jgi:AcrR family transcriptional regulator
LVSHFIFQSSVDYTTIVVYNTNVAKLRQWAKVSICCIDNKEANMLANSPTEKRLDPRTKRTRQLLVDAFGKLLSQKSFEEITVQDITELATVNRATFYAHFEDKYDLLDHSVTEMIRAALHKKLPPGTSFSPGNLELLIETICEFLDLLRTHCAPSNRSQFDSLVEQQVKLQVNGLVLKWVQELKPERSPDSAQTELQATVASWAIYGVAIRWSTKERKEPAAEFARQALPLVLAGLQADTGAAPRTARTKK